MDTLGTIGELSAISRVIRTLPGRDDVVVGPGDDCAVVRVANGMQEDLVFTSDPVVAGIHFDADADPKAVGHKAVGRSLSDIAAMGGVPRWALVDIVAPKSTPIAAVDALYAGMVAIASTHGLAIVGGDMAEGPCLEVHVFAVGSVPSGRALLRSTAGHGDILFVTGSLGGSRRGRHLCVEPRLAEGIWLRDWASAMIDLSDGLASDLYHVTDMSGVGCDLNMDRIPIAAAACQMDDDLTPVEHALYDGEDFELLFTVPLARRDAFIAAWHGQFDVPCTEIGLMTEDAGLVRCVHSDAEGVAMRLDRKGYSHF